MLPLSALGLIRFDVEDYLTVESDDALKDMLASMRRAGMPGSYALVGKKVEALVERGRFQLLQDLAQERSLGFHSLSHSQHPTIAEELAELTYDQAVDRFVEREAPGVDVLTEYVRAPRFFTQPGGNWVPEAAEALPDLGMDLYFTDSFNSYVVDLDKPYWYGRVVLFSFPVVNPRPFGLGLPGNLNEAVRLIEERQSQSGAFMVMLHPTELVTSEFWDVTNYAHGKTRQPLVPAPVRSPQQQAAALKSFAQYLQEIRGLRIEWTDAVALRQKVAPRRPIVVNRAQLRDAIRRDGWGPITVPGGFLSAAEALYALALVYGAPDARLVNVGYVGAPAAWEASASLHAVVASGRLNDYARALVGAVRDTGRLPSNLDMPLEQIMAALLGEVVPLSFLQYIKDPPKLHWDWPIFPPHFHPLRLWQDARRLAWTLKPATLTDGSS
ncbi:MAG: hypothetical protein C7B45_13465 [Sulfobacillus acidophilus]|uniref:NodB homology domain-containing protein n=1 Tax=Sulfobacillus acidophilus TaxID=53633 RepID=A0A2T2WEV5_9FIRM|nr:MAG: hypothetical protein C7B45_13465 [Sulfobacillus acidophilus]